MHCFASQNQTYAGTVIFGVESVKSLKGQENQLLRNRAYRKRPIFVMENIFVGKYDIQSTNETPFERDCNFTRVFDFPPSDLMCPRYFRLADARMRMQNALLL